MFNLNTNEALEEAGLENTFVTRNAYRTIVGGMYLIGTVVVVGSDVYWRLTHPRTTLYSIKTWPRRRQLRKALRDPYSPESISLRKFVEERTGVPGISIKIESP